MTHGEPAYESLGTTYRATRSGDPAIGRRLRAALGDATSVVSIGAGTGSYEPPDIPVIAVEPSPTMIAQRPPGSAPARLGVAEALPLADGEVDAALATLTTHHWADFGTAIEEIRRVVRRRAVFLTWDPDAASFWLLEDYFPWFVEDGRGRFPPLAAYEALGPAEVEVVPIPRDCRDGFASAYWAHPEAYLDPGRRANISGFHYIPEDQLRDGLDRLRADLHSGAWERRYAVAGVDELDCGYRLIKVEITR